jgi:drug/metabolite transporter (DMT)-like permease
MNTRNSFLTLKKPTYLRKATPTLLSSNAASEDAQAKIILDKERALGILVLLSVPLSWGTYGPVVRYLYELQPPVPGFVFSAAYYVVASLALLTLSSTQQTRSIDYNETEQDNVSLIISENNDFESTKVPIIGGLELGTYLFLGNGLQILGLKTVPADRAGFLVQLTTVMVPIVQAIFSGNLKEIPIPTWGACLLAFTGVVIMGLDGKESMLLLSNENGGLWSSLSSSLSTFTQGDLLIVLAALVYTLHVVRLGKYAKETTPLKLAASKATTEAMLSVGLVSLLWFIGNMASGDASGLLGYAQETGRGISTFFSTISEGLASGAVPRSALVPALCATIWTGLVTCAYTIYAQSFGQRRVSPTEANLIYTVQPIFTALFAWGLLGETLGPAGFIGAACIGSSVYTVAMMNNK